jgi:hypothetical protein
MQKTLILLGLTAYAFGAQPIKNRLIQSSMPVETPDDPVGLPELELCTCELTETVGSGFPECEQGNVGSSGADIVETVGEEIVSIPDSAFNSLCESECCACNVGQHIASSTGTRTKHYDITGTIDIAETIDWEETGDSEEESRGYSIKETACVTNNEDVEGEPVEVPGECPCPCPEY